VPRQLRRWDLEQREEETLPVVSSVERRGSDTGTKEEVKPNFRTCAREEREEGARGDHHEGREDSCEDRSVRPKQAGMSGLPKTRQGGSHSVCQIRSHPESSRKL
jgi:hypothetical protein